MGTRTIWQNLYGIMHATGSPATGYAVDTNKFLATPDIGLEVGKHAIPIIGNPSLDPGKAIIDQRKAVGISTRRTGAGYEYQQGVEEPTVTLEMEAIPNMIALFSWLLFQKGGSEGVATPFTKTFIPYTDPACEIWASILQQMSAEDADSHVIHGAICQSMTLSAAEGEALKLSATMNGSRFFDTFDFDAQASVLAVSEKAPLLFQDCGQSPAVLTLDGAAINIPGFSITITNNAVGKKYANAHIYEFILGDLTGDGTFTMPWGQATEGANEQLDNFIAGIDTVLVLEWGTAGSEGHIKIEANCRYTGAPLGGDDEIVTECPFDLVYDGTNDAIKITVSDAVDRGIS